MLEGDIGPFLLPSSYISGTDAYLIKGLTDTTVTEAPTAQTTSGSRDGMSASTGLDTSVLILPWDPTHYR
ncbi:MAG TPA: hypothetical protein EYG28_03420 [Nitrospiria bacterium]|nr:hypothetical protein [Candidatus Manganitrophaceae bacterium]HIL34440.1 hypothetical protein [Candidatus Manganitrophaceae bacterium]